MYYRPAHFRQLLSHINLYFKDSSKYPLVSIVIPLYNEEKFFAACLDSLLRQSYKNWECVIVNDCSTDSSRSIAEQYQARDPRFKIVDHEVNKGLPASRNTGLKNVQGEYVTFLDSDDFLLQHSLWRRVLTLHGTQERVAGSFCGMVHVQESGVIAKEHRLYLNKSRQAPVSFLTAKGECPFNVHAVLLKTAAVKQAGGFREELRWGAEDWDLWQRMLRNGYVFLPSGFMGAAYRQKRGSMVRSLVHQHCEQGLRLIEEVTKPMEMRDFIQGAPLQYVEPHCTYITELSRTKRLVMYYASAYINKDEESMRLISAQFKKGFLPYLKANMNFYDLVDMAVARHLCLSIPALKHRKKIYRGVRTHFLREVESQLK
ncbi:MAG: glycosyltransferase family 2 protein [Pseudobdellovibrionaceae bacterium]